ncbi:alpha-ketoglutarate-dependent dioxygenase AlkB [Lysobacter sp. A3-1-A15]|uniref:alpha-ketoglutarate-dependent dioxygenase AlkB n=1 Tax=Novilysobacter viscosus TaxID=3098602 RepID=UPI002EDBB618
MHALHAMTDDLFAPGVVQLVDDAEGGIRYWPAAIDPALARDWFDTLRAGAAWTHLQRPMYDRVVDVPRLLASYAVDDLPAELPLADLLAWVQARAPAPYSRIGLNLYRDGNDSVAMHGDKLHTLRAGHPITLVSLGAPRRMLIRARAGARGTLAVDLAPGSILSMSHASQSTHEHGIPKTRRPQGPRLSVVFRARA